jgi:hypothetical protein
MPLRTVAALTVALALAAPAAPALADGFTLDLAAPSPVAVGHPLVLQATGTIPPDDVGFPYWFSLDAIPTSLTTTCPPDRWEGEQFGNANGSVIVLTQKEQPDLSGHFTIPVAVTPSAPGSVLLCGYTDDGSEGTMAGASLVMDIVPASSGGGRGSGSHKPSPPSYAAQGVRSCRALLTGRDARSCIRGIVRRANARCRRRPSRHARAHCRRAVRRAARRAS